MRSCTATQRGEATRVPRPAGPYRGVRANTEQTTVREGLDHYGREPCAMAAKVRAPGAAQCGNRDQIRPEIPDALRNPCWRHARPVGPYRAFGARTERIPASPRGPVLV